jgi:hypothetical protein
VVVDEAHGRDHARRIALAREVRKALAVRHGDRQPAAGHALEEQAGRLQHLDQRQRASNCSLWLRVKRGQASAPGMMGASAASIWQPLHTQRQRVGPAKKARNCSASTGLNMMLRAQPSPAPSVSP